MIGKNVVVTTKSRRWLVLHGILRSMEGDTVVLEHCRCAVYYSTATRSHLGLAITGPAVGSRISSAVDEATVCGVEMVFPATAEASAVWERGEWS